MKSLYRKMLSTRKNQIRNNKLNIWKRISVYLSLVLLCTVASSCASREEAVDPEGDIAPSFGLIREESFDLENYAITDQTGKYVNNKNSLFYGFEGDFEGIYDITSLIPKLEGKKLYTAAFKSADELILVYQETVEEEKYIYSTYLCKLGTDMFYKYQRDFTTRYRYVDFLQMDPMIYVADDKVARSDYNFVPEFQKEDPEKYFNYLAYENEVYTVVNDGFLYKFAPNGKGECVFALPMRFSCMYPQWCDDPNTLKFMCQDSFNGNTVYLDLDMTQEEITPRFYTQEYYDDYFKCVGKNRYATVSYPDNKIEYVNTELDTKKELKLSDKENAYLNFSQDSAFQDKLILITDPDCELGTEIFIWDTTVAETKKFEKNFKNTYEFKETNYDDITLRAKELETTYGVSIILGDNVPSELSSYYITPCTDLGKMNRAIDILEETLSIYPAGFFDKLEEGFVRDTAIYLTGRMTPVYPDQNIDEPAGLTNDLDGLFVMLYDIDSWGLDKSTIVHELSHVIDRSLIFNNCFDDYVWCSYNPPGFQYYYSYIDEYGVEYQNTSDYTYTSYANVAYDDVNTVYFYDVYAKTFPTEDRARFFEHLVTDDYYDFVFESEAVQKKLDYYFTAIRHCYQTDSWPEETQWEKRLREYKEGT